jgi:FtsH-binding integral membrane protein
MIVLSGAAILYQTQTIIRQFPGTAYVAAAVQLFGSLMTMFWYVLRLLMQLTRN